MVASRASKSKIHIEGKKKEKANAKAEGARGIEKKTSVTTRDSR